MAVAEVVEEGGGRPTAIRFPVWSHAAWRRSNRYLMNTAGPACPLESGWPSRRTRTHSHSRSHSRSRSRSRQNETVTTQIYPTEMDDLL
jgi:hypothetical protein